MEFAEILKNNLSKKYDDLFNGKTESVLSDVDLNSATKASERYLAFSARIRAEESKINKCIDDVTKQRENRLAKEKHDAELAERNKKNEEKIQKEEEERARMANERRVAVMKKVVESSLQIIAYLSPIVISIIFGIILFTNIDQISIVSNFVGWCTGWVFFAIASLFVSLFLLGTRLFHAWNYDDVAARVSASIVAVLMIVSSIIGFSNSAKLSRDFDPSTFVSIQVTGKNTSIKNGYYVTTISFSHRNKSDIKVNSIEGEAIFYNRNTEVNTWNVSFKGPFKAGNSYNLDVNFNEYSPSLYNVSYANLGMSFRVTSMTFNDNNRAYSINGKTVTLKQGNVNGGSSGNTSESDFDENEFTEVTDRELNSTMELLKWLHHDVSSDVIVPTQGICYISYTNNCNCYTADYSDSCNGSSVFFKINESYKSNLVSSFKQKLIDYGWTCQYDDDFSYEYSKNDTHIVFSNVQESGTWVDYYKYDIDYYYMNYSAFVVNS